MIYVFIGIAVIALLIAGPFATIWALNTLFDTGISYTFWPWLATAWLSLLIASPNVSTKK